jgi:hypothetical protein
MPAKARDVAWSERPWSAEAHLSEQNIPGLRDLVEPAFSQPSAHACYRARAHGAELQNEKRLSPHAHAHLTKKHLASIEKHDAKRD